MPVNLYHATVPSYLQILTAVRGFLGKGREFCSTSGIDPSELVEACLHSDMWPLRFQIVSVAHHSRGALDSLGTGVFTPPQPKPDLDYAGLQALIDEAETAVCAKSPDEVNGAGDRDLVFQLGERKIPFVASDFLFSFSLPNFYFHATTAYDILRHKGVPLGKRDFLGQLRIKR